MIVQSAPVLRAGGSRRLLFGFLLAIILVTLVAATSAFALGELSQKPGGAGCVSAKVDGCAKATGLAGADEVTVSPDGKHLYVASSTRGTISIFKRGAGSGALAQVRGGMRGLDQPRSVAVSPDGHSGYVTTSGGVTILDRNPAGALTQRQVVAIPFPRAAAISPDGRNVYVAARDAVLSFDRDPATGALVAKPGQVLGGGEDLAISPDGRSAYVVDQLGATLSILDRDPATGALSQKPGAVGCISQRQGPCAKGRALAYADQVLVSPDGRSVYVASYGGNGIAVFERDPVSGALAQKPAAAGCIAEYPVHQDCRQGRALDQPQGVAISPDGKRVYAASVMAESVSILTRNPATGALTQKPGATGCVSQSGTAAVFEEEEDEKGVCRKARALAFASDVAVSPDGRSVYVASPNPGAVAVFQAMGGSRP